MDSNKSLLRAFDRMSIVGKENHAQENTPMTPAARRTSIKTNALTLSAFFNRYAHPHPRLEQHGDITVDSECQEKKEGPALGASVFGPEFAGGVRRESFPGKHSHVPDISFNFEGVQEENSSDINNISHTGQHADADLKLEDLQAPTTSTVPNPDVNMQSDNGLLNTVRIVAPRLSVAEPDYDKFPLASPLRPVTGPDSPVTSFVARTVSTRAPIPMQITPIPETFTEKEPGNTSLPKLKLDLGQGFEFDLADEENGKVKASHIKSDAMVRTNRSQTLAARAAALHFSTYEQSVMELDSIMDVQLPEGRDEEATTAFRWDGRLESSVMQPRQASVTILKRQASVSSHRSQESSSGHHKQEFVATEKASAPASPQETTPSPSLRPRRESTTSSLAPSAAENTLPDDELTLNIAALGLSGFGNTLLVDTSLDQLKSKTEAGDGTFGGASFAIASSSIQEDRNHEILEFKTPMVRRTVSNPLSEHEDSDVDMSVEATAKKPTSNKARVVSDAVVDALRSGRALQKVASSITTAGDTGDQTHRGSLSKGVGSLEFRSHLHKRSESATPLHRTGSGASDHRIESMRTVPRTHDLPKDGIDAEDDVSYSRPSSTMSRPSSRLSSTYTPSSYTSSYNRAKMVEQTGRRGSTVSSSDRPSSVASIRTTSTRPDSAASERLQSIAGITTTSTNRLGGSGMHLHPTCAGSENLMHLTQRMESGLKDDMEAFILDDMEEYMRSEDDACIQRSRAAPLARTQSAITPPTERPPSATGRPLGASTSSTRETSTRLRPRSSMLPPPATTSKIGSRGPCAPSTGMRALGSGIGAPRSLSSKSSNGTLGAKPAGTTPGAKASSTTPGARSSTLGLSGGAKTASAGSSRMTSTTPATLGSRSSTSVLRPRSSIGPSPAPSLRAARSTIASAMEPPKTLRPRASTLGLFAPDGGPGQETRRLTHKSSAASISTTAGATSAARTLRPTSSTLSMRGAAKQNPPTSSKNNSHGAGSSGSGSLSNTAPLSKPPAGSIASLREAKYRGSLSRR